MKPIRGRTWRKLCRKTVAFREQIAGLWTAPEDHSERGAVAVMSISADPAISVEVEKLLERTGAR